MLKIFIACVILLCSNTFVLAGIITIVPEVDGSIRDYGVKDGMPDIVIGNSLVQILNDPSMEDRGIVEFSLSELSLPVSNAWLVLPMFDSNGPFPFEIDVYTYQADGVLSLQDWSRGYFDSSFSYTGEGTIALDVSSFITGALSAQYTYAGFNLRFAVPSDITPNGSYVAFGSLEITPSSSLAINPLIGDANFDGIVDEKDAAALAENWLTSGASRAQGDFNGDNIVNDIDATLLAANWNHVSASTTVPEPSALMLTLLGIMMLTICRVNRHRDSMLGNPGTQSRNPFLQHDCRCQPPRSQGDRIKTVFN